MIMMPGGPASDPCATCRKISDNFVAGYKKTAASNFGGGNTDWEEKRLKGYAKSETRLIEIMESACSTSESQCSTFLEKYEDPIEEWYQEATPAAIGDFHNWLCIETAKVCCPDGTFGKNCRRCQHGDHGLVCSGHGYCNGDGTRSGNGRCECHTSYNGTNCSNCEHGYTKSIDSNNDVVCTDIDECTTNILLSPCLLYKCNNTQGAYECYGKPFYHEVPKISALVVLILTGVVFMCRDLHGPASITFVIAIALLIAFAKNLL